VAEIKKSTYEKRGGNIYRRDLLVLIFNFILKVLFNSISSSKARKAKYFINLKTCLRVQ